MLTMTPGIRVDPRVFSRTYTPDSRTYTPDSHVTPRRQGMASGDARRPLAATNSAAAGRGWAPAAAGAHAWERPTAKMAVQTVHVESY